MDVRKLEFADATFDMAIDKGTFDSGRRIGICSDVLLTQGTMDAMMTSKGDVWV
jgi:hypothetical protein